MLKSGHSKAGRCDLSIFCILYYSVLHSPVPSIRVPTLQSPPPVILPLALVILVMLVRANSGSPITDSHCSFSIPSILPIGPVVLFVMLNALLIARCTPCSWSWQKYVSVVDSLRAPLALSAKLVGAFRFFASPPQW
jgi:hypothetical protein